MDVKEKDDLPLKDELQQMVLNKKRHLNVVFIGHVDVGKSTNGGQILLLSDQVDDHTMQKYEKEAKYKSRESWYMAYTNEEERVKLQEKTVEVGRAHFETETTRILFEYVILIYCLRALSTNTIMALFRTIMELLTAT